MGLSDLTVSGLDRLKSRSLRFESSVMSCKRALIVTPYVTIKHIGIYEESNDNVKFDLEKSVT